MIDTSKIIEAIDYLLKKLSKTDKLKLIKLIYLADKYHLVHYGRTITKDDYYAMYHGPVGSTVKDVLEFNTFTLSEEEFNYASSLFRHADLTTNSFVHNNINIEYDNLSETDKEALDFVITKFGDWDSWRLRDFTHQYPEWKQYEPLLQNNSTKRKRIEPEELLTVIPEDGIQTTEEHLKQSRNILLGMYE